MNGSVIERDVGEQAKGPRLQKLRALSLLLDAIEKHDQANALCAVEYCADVSIKDASTDTVKHYLEEDKNYDAATSFTLMSEPVRNTIVIFLDSWAQRRFSRNVLFGFYTPNTIAKERNTESTIQLGITWPSEPMLKLLAAKTGLCAEVINTFRTIVLAEYRTQYTSPTNPGHINTFDGWSDSDWIDFIQQVHWGFGQEDEAALEATLITRIKSCKHYHNGLSGREHFIISEMLNLLDRRQILSDPTERTVHVAELVLLFHEIAAGQRRLPDPAWKTWEALPAPADTRNLEAKVLAVSPALPRVTVGRWSRTASNSLIEQENLRHDKTVLSFKYQVFDACEKALSELVEANNGNPITQGKIEEWVEALIAVAQARITDRSQDYIYPVRSNEFLRGLVWELIDSCFLAFDGGAHV